MCIYNELKEREHEQFLIKQKKERFIVSFSRIGILVLFLVLWEMAARLGWINQFITSSPSRVFETRCV